MSSVSKSQDDQAWAQGEVYGWLWESLGIEVPGPDDPGTDRMLVAIATSLDLIDGDLERVGALLMELSLAGRALIHALAESTGETPAQALSRLLPGPPKPGHTIGGSRY